MQIFISNEYTHIDNNITINDKRIVHQCYNVLRYKKNQIFILQNKNRYTLSINTISKSQIETEIINIEYKKQEEKREINMYIALPNRREKWEMIVQKLTEIWVDNIIFRKAERSIIRDIQPKKIERLNNIIIESSEQSFRRTIPKISYEKDILKKNTINFSNSILFNPNWKEPKNLNLKNLDSINWIIWPEWWFSQKEIEAISTKSININLWNTILRMETAAIIWSWYLKNL